MDENVLFQNGQISASSQSSQADPVDQSTQPVFTAPSQQPAQIMSATMPQDEAQVPQVTAANKVAYQESQPTDSAPQLTSEQPPVEVNPVDVPQPVVMQQAPSRREEQSMIQDVAGSQQGQGVNSEAGVPTMPETPKQPIDEDEGGGFHIPRIVKILGGVVAVFIIALIILAVLAGRSNNSTGGKATLTFWGLWEDANTMQPIIASFERQNPGITVNYIKEDPRQYTERLTTRIKDGNGPDIFEYHNSWLPMLTSFTLPLSTDVISKSDFENIYYPVMQKDLVKNGAVYGIPTGIDTLSLFVNKDMFEKAGISVPSTWDDFVTTAKSLTVKDSAGKIKTAGTALGSFKNITHAPDIVSLLFAQNGVNLSAFTSSSNASDALTFYNSFTKGTNNVWDDTLDPSQSLFAQGKLAMYFGYSWDVLTFRALNPQLNFAVYPVPHLPGRNITIASYWVDGVSFKSTHQKEALLFMHYLAQKDTAQVLYTQEAKTRLFGEPYARKDLADTLKDNPLVYPFIQQANDSVSTPFSGETFDTGIDAQMNGYLGIAVTALASDTSAQSAVDTLAQGVAQVYKQYGQTTP